MLLLILSTSRLLVHFLDMQAPTEIILGVGPELRELGAVKIVPAAARTEGSVRVFL